MNAAMDSQISHQYKSDRNPFEQVTLATTVLELFQKPVSQDRIVKCKLETLGEDRAGEVDPTMRPC